jgi:hypothetical protein
VTGTPEANAGSGWPKRSLDDRAVVAYRDAMTTVTQTPANERKMAQLTEVLGEMLAEVLRRGFFGTACVELVIQDGTIQSIRRRVERVER